MFVSDVSRVFELPVGGSQRTLPFTVDSPDGVAVDPAGDVFVTENQVVELPVGGSRQTLPFTGLNAPYGVAVDAAGDVFVSDDESNRVEELSPSVPSGSLVVSPGSGRPGTGIGVSSVTPCPLGGPFGSAGVTLGLYSPSGAVAQTANAALDGAGNWFGTLSIPAGATHGTTYFVGARCRDPEGVVAQDYAYGAFAVTATSTGGLGLPRLISPTVRCKAVSKVTICTVTYQYSATARPANARVEATIKVHGRSKVVGRGTIRRHKLKLTLKHLHSGRYELTLLALKSHRRSVVIGDITLTISLASRVNGCAASRSPRGAPSTLTDNHSGRAPTTDVVWTSPGSADRSDALTWSQLAGAEALLLVAAFEQRSNQERRPADRWIGLHAAAAGCHVGAQLMPRHGPRRRQHRWRRAALPLRRPRG